MRARAGLLNILIGSALALVLMEADPWGVAVALGFVLLDMLAAVLFGPTPFSPLGVIATWLTRAYEPQWTPHLPKRFAWSMGAGLAAACLSLQVLSAETPWLFGVLVVFFILTWLDAALGFCLGCWIYSRLFGCRTCHVS